MDVSTVSGPEKRLRAMKKIADIIQTKQASHVLSRREDAHINTTNQESLKDTKLFTSIIQTKNPALTRTKDAHIST